MQNLKKMKIHTILLIVFILLMAIYQFALYFNSPWESGFKNVHQVANNNILIKSFPFFSFAILLFFTILILFEGKKYPSKILIPVITLIIFGIFWVGYSILYNGISITLLIRSNMGPTLMFLPILVMVGYKNYWWKIIKKTISILSILATFYAFYECLNSFYLFGFSYRITYGAPMYVYTLGLYTTYGVITFTDDWLKKSKALYFIVLIMLVFNSAILQGRSWFIQTIILFIIYTMRVRNNFKKFSFQKIFLPFMIVFSVFIVLIMNVELLYGLIDRFLNSGDTRTNQLKTFFDQVSMGELLIGQGIYASYSFNGDPNFKFIDNQVLLFSFKYGAIPTLMYCILFLYPIFKSIFLRNKKLMLKSIVLMSWFAAMLGLSVFFNITFNLVHSLVLMLVGRLFYEIETSQKV